MYLISLSSSPYSTPGNKYRPPVSLSHSLPSRPARDFPSTGHVCERRPEGRETPHAWRIPDSANGFFAAGLRSSFLRALSLFLSLSPLSRNTKTPIPRIGLSPRTRTPFSPRVFALSDHTPASYAPMPEIEDRVRTLTSLSLPLHSRYPPLREFNLNVAFS